MNNELNSPFQMAFNRSKGAGKVAFMPFLVAGDPDFKKSLKIIKLISRYSDLIEIGFPYSDPLADGPTIQAADDRALKGGMDTDKVFDFVKAVRAFCNQPITVLVYANLVYQYGLDSFYSKCAQVGINGVLVPDVPMEEVRPFVASARKYTISQIFMVTQTTTGERLQKILKYAEGYLYLVSVLGVTGSRNSFQKETFDFIKAIKKSTSLPLALGFGISTRKQIEQVASSGIDGVIVGSAIIKVIADNVQDPASKVEKFIMELLAPRK